MFGIKVLNTLNIIKVFPEKKTYLCVCDVFNAVRLEEIFKRIKTEPCKHFKIKKLKRGAGSSKGGGRRKTERE